MRPHQHRDHDTGAPLIPLEEARRRAHSRISALPPADLPLREAYGCVLAEDVRAPGDLPPFTSSAMDGFAVRAADVAGADRGRPVPLRVVERVPMGMPPNRSVVSGDAVEIPTGGQLPPGADAVVPLEQTVSRVDRVLILVAVPPGRHVRPAGQDVRAGEVVAAAGTRLGAADLGLIASAGIGTVSVRPRARVGILSTGDELVEPGVDPAPGRIPDANAYILHGCVVEAGAVPVPLGRVRDDPAALADALHGAVHRVDVLVSSGGVSVGERDPVRAAFGGRGGVEFVEVAMQPGKPQAFGAIGGRPYFGLPGNPVSVFVSFEVFVRPALMVMMGRPPERPAVTATLDTDITGPAEKVQFARVHLLRSGDGWRASSTGDRQSNLLATVARATGLAVIPAGVATARAGQQVPVMLFRDPEDR